MSLKSKVSDNVIIREMSMDELTEVLKTLTDPKLIALAESQIRQLGGKKN